jgi:hypothetical protein
MTGTFKVSLDGLIVPRGHRISEQDLLGGRALLCFARGVLQNKGVSLELIPDDERCVLSVPEWGACPLLTVRWPWSMLTAGRDAWLRELDHLSDHTAGYEQLDAKA